MKCFARNDLLSAQERALYFNPAVATMWLILRALVCALWRDFYEQGPRQSAIDQGTEGDYAFHPIWFNNPRYRREVTLTDLRDRIGT
jgi:hypothetical protein